VAESSTRKLAAIMFTDMVGYTSLMQEDEDKARELIQRHRSLMKPLVEKHNGEVIQYVGDGTFCRFDSAKEAVNAALEIQYVLKVEKELALRIGIHLGDVVVEGDEVYGDGVNVASRIEPLAKPGGICVSHQVYENIKNQTGLSITSLGKKELKNVDEEMEVFDVAQESEPARVAPAVAQIAPISKKINMKWTAITAVVILLVIIGLKVDFGTMEAESNEDTNSLSIAVLPFTNMSADAENEFFSDGITEDILTQLSKIKSLEVISRTSIMQYKNTTKSLRQIGKELGVATILEGSVRRGGNRVRITAQLIDTETDKHIWADTYDRDLDDIFAIQSDVAKKIATALKASLTPEEEKRIDQKPTDNIEAYDYYLRGKTYANRSYLESDFSIGIQMLQKAIDLDPDFSLAYAALSQIHSGYYWFYFDRSEERLVKARAAADKALQLNSQLQEAHMALGMYYYHGRLDYQNALKEFDVAQEMGLNSGELYANIGFVQRRQGKIELAIDNLIKALELSPREAMISQNLGETYSLIRNYPEAENSFNKAISLSPDLRTNYYEKALLFVRWKGDIKKARTILEEVEQMIGTPADQRDIILKYFFDKYDRKFDQALELLLSLNDDIYEGQFNYLHKNHLIADTYGFLGNSELAQVYYDSSRVVFEKLVEENPGDSRIYSSLGLVYAGIGRKEDAIRAGEKGVELLPISKEAWRGAYRLEDLAIIYAKVGELDLAIDHLETLLSIPGDLSVNLIRLDPKWDPLRDHPRFLALLEKFAI